MTLNFNFPDNAPLNLAESIKAVEAGLLGITGYKTGTIDLQVENEIRTYDCTYLRTDKGLLYVTNKAFQERFNILAQSYPNTGFNINLIFKNTQYGTVPSFTINI